MSFSSPLELLHSIRNDALKISAQQETSNVQLVGEKCIAFLVNNVRLFCPADSVREVALCDHLIPVPQTKSWMRGLVNSKGVIYSVSDLSLFSGSGRAIAEKKGQILLLNNDNEQCGLLVSKVIGFRFFDRSESEEVEYTDPVVEGLSSFVKTMQKEDGVNWYGVDVGELISSAQFLEVQ